MKQKSRFYKLFYVVVLFALSAATMSAQTSLNTFKDFGYKGGLQINAVLPTTEFESDNGLSLSSYLIKGFFRFELNKDWQVEASAGYGKLSGDGGTYYKPNSEYKTSLIPIEGRLLYTPFDELSWNPYFFAGLGLINYDVTQKPTAVSPKPVDANGWNMNIPLGVGAEIKLSDEVALDLSVGYTWTLTDNLNYYSIKGTNDGYLHAGVGISFSNESWNTDKDKDGLTRKEEAAIGTDPLNPDTDNDGLKDGEEVNKYKTDPLKADTDNDGLSDYDELMKYQTDPIKADTDNDGLNDGDEVLKFKTNPLKADTDGDGLKDGEEVMKYKTDPLKVDTDGDGLKDGEEVLKYKTDPLKVDTDGDGLTDGDEVLKYKTDPLKVDTDGGTIGDGVEVNRGTNPLDPSDDVPPAIQKIGIIHFGFDKSNLTTKSKKTLNEAYDVLKQHSDAKVTLSGHTDSVGPDKYNQKLSEKRANAAQKYLVKKGISKDQIKTVGYGETNPVESNKTAKGRAMNRRTEIEAEWVK